MADLTWVDMALAGSRPRAVAALCRYFRDIDLAEEAFHEACLAALATWPERGPPASPAGWLIAVGRNYGIDTLRRTRRQRALQLEVGGVGDRAPVSEIEDDALDAIEREDYRDDVLRLLFVCCHPDLPATQQIALALRLVSGLSVSQIARAFLVSDAAMEQRITRAKRVVVAADVPFEPPGARERRRRLDAVAAMIYLLFNEGYSAAQGTAAARAPLCEEAIRLARLLLRLYPAEPEVMGLNALLVLHYARAAARFDATGDVVLLEEQDRKLWDRTLIQEGLALLDKAMRHRRSGPYQVQAAIAALHARARRPEVTDWAGIDQLFATLERMRPSPVVTLNRAVAVSKLRGAAAALEMIEPLARRLSTYFHFHGVRGALLTELGRDAEARAALTRAIGLARTPAEAAHIRRHLDRLLNATA